MRKYYNMNYEKCIARAYICGCIIIVASAMYLYILESYHPTLKIWCSYTLFDIMFYQQCPSIVK